MMKKLVLIFTILILNISSVFSQCYSAGHNLPGTGYGLNSSGNVKLDKIVRDEIIKLEKFFGVNVDFYFLLETYDANAMYFKSCSNNCNGTVYLGIKLLIDQLQKEHGIECVKAILAHEFGHCVQHLMNWNELGKRQELHSDFMSGYYTGRTYSYTDDVVAALFNEFFSMGDNQIWDPKHHGTNGERECAFLEGYYFAKENNTTVATANTYGVQYVVADNPCAIRKYYYYKDLFDKDVALGNIGGIHIAATDKKMYYVTMTNFEGRTFSGVFNHKNRELKFDRVATSFKYDFKLYRRSLFYGDIFLGTITLTPQKGTTSEVVLHGNSIYFGDGVIDERKKIEALRQSYLWIGSLGLSLQPFTIGVPLSFYLERKIGYQGWSARGNLQVRVNSGSSSFLSLGGDLKKFLRIPFLQNPFVGPTLAFTTLKTKASYYNESSRATQLYLGCRFGSGRDIWNRFYFGWDFSTGLMIPLANGFGGPYADINAQIGMRF